jgi:hypothetical protein
MLYYDVGKSSALPRGIDVDAGHLTEHISKVDKRLVLFKSRSLQDIRKEVDLIY